MADPSYPIFSVFAFLGFIVALIPLPWHLQAWNSGTCLFMLWTSIGCLNLFINSIVWHKNIVDWAPVWCDISSRLTVGISVAIPAASLCINRRLYNIASCQTVSLSLAHKRRAVMVDLAIGLGLPALQMALQFIVQGHRYDIWEDIGCYPTTVNTPAAYPLSFVWPNAIGIVSAAYCILTLRAFMKRRAQFSQFLTSNTSLTLSRYFRLMALATVELVVNTPLSAYGLYLNATARPIYPWKSWADIHFDWYTIDTIPAILWRSSQQQVVTLELSRWSIILCAILFFAFFGFADEARKHYRFAYQIISKRLSFLPQTSLRTKAFFNLDKPKNTMNQPTLTLPSFVVKVPPPPHLSRTSLISTDCSSSTYHKESDTKSYPPSFVPMYKSLSDDPSPTPSSSQFSHEPHDTSHTKKSYT